MPRFKPVSRALPAVLALAAALALPACGDESTTGSKAGSDAESTRASDTGPGLDGLPKDLKAAYADSGQTTEESPYFTFRAKDPPPWTIAYVSTFAGNTWRADVMAELKKQFAEYKAAGLVDKLIVTESNNDVGRTSQQIRQALDKGADGILTIAPSATGINPAIDAAFRKGVPVVNFTSPVTSVNAINTGVNYYQAGRKQAEYVAGKVGSGGQVIYVNGIPGFAASEQMKEGSLDVYNEKGIKVVAKPDGIWTNSIAKAALLKTLSTNPGKLDFVHQQSGMAQGTLEALKQTGRAEVPVTVADDVAGAAAWRENKELSDLGFSEFPARSEARLAFDVLVRTLQGQGPKITSILREPTTFTFDELAEILPAGADTKNTDWVESISEEYYTETLPKFFSKPADPKTAQG